MADVPVVFTRRLTRNKLAAALGNDHDVIKTFENMTLDVQSTLPNAIAGATQDQGSILAAGAFLPPPPNPLLLAPVDTSAQILASQIFGG